MNEVMEEQLYRLNRTLTLCWSAVTFAFVTLFLVSVHHQVTPLFAFTWTHQEFIDFIWGFGGIMIPFFIVGALAETKMTRIEQSA
jgi:hypothetical protein